MTQLVHGLLEPRHHSVAKHNVCVPLCGRSRSLALLRSLQLTRGLAPSKRWTVQARRVTTLRTPVVHKHLRLGPFRLVTMGKVPNRIIVPVSGDERRRQPGPSRTGAS